MEIIIKFYVCLIIYSFQWQLRLLESVLVDNIEFETPNHISNHQFVLRFFFKFSWLSLIFFCFSRVFQPILVTSYNASCLTLQNHHELSNYRFSYKVFLLFPKCSFCFPIFCPTWLNHRKFLSITVFDINTIYSDYRYCCYTSFSFSIAAF